MKPEDFKKDERSPKELANAILDHVFTEDEPGRNMTFRELLLHDYGTPDQLHPKTYSLVHVLKKTGGVG